MTHNTVATERESGGSTEVVFHTIDITGLDAAGAETYDPDAETNVSVGDRAVSVVAQEDETLAVVWDHVDAGLKVKNLSDATDVVSGTAVGQVVLRVEGT